MSGTASGHTNFTLFDSLPIGALVINKEFKIVYWNRTLEVWTGMDKNRIVGKSLLDSFPNLNQKKYADRIKQIFTGAPSAVFSSLLHRYLIPVEGKDGSFRSQNSTVTPMVSPSGEVFAMFFIQDVTELSARIRDFKNMRDKAIQEIKERQKVEEKLRLMAAVIENTAEGVIITDTQGNIQIVNKSFTKITGYSEREALGNTPRLLRSGRHNEHFYNNMWRQINETGFWVGEFWNKRKNGSIYPQKTSISPVMDANGKLSHYAGIFLDITDRKIVEDELRKLSTTDGLTDVSNRRNFDFTLDMEWKRTRRDKTPLSLLMIDIDRFKLYNDTYGHLAGDKCIQSVANSLKGFANRPGDLVARYGGEEFTVLLPGVDRLNAETIAQSIRSHIEFLEIPHPTSGVSKFVSISAGVATVSIDHGATPSELVELADKALYQAKRAGRNRIYVYENK